MNIIEIALNTPELSTLVAAVKAAGLVETLSGPGPFTVFAPTNAAFDKLPAGTVASLLEPGNIDMLTSILTYHVVGDAVESGDLSNGPVDTLNGESLKVTISDSNVMINDSTVEKADIVADNGVVHLIDNVLMPAAK